MKVANSEAAALGGIGKFQTNRMNMRFIIEPDISVGSVELAYGNVDSLSCDSEIGNRGLIFRTQIIGTGTKMTFV